MRTLAFYISLLIACFGGKVNAQSTLPDSLRRTASYKQVVTVPGSSADELYARAREWVALTFEDVHQVVQLDDPNRHLLIGSGYTKVQSRRPNGTVKNSVSLWFRFRLETRDGRYRIEFTDLGSVRGFSYGQYASQDVGYWLGAGHATRVASTRHGVPGESLDNLLGTGDSEDRSKIKTAIDEAMNPLLSTLKQVETVVPGAW